MLCTSRARIVAAEGESASAIPGSSGESKTFKIPAQLIEQVRRNIEMRHRFDAAAATTCDKHLGPNQMYLPADPFPFMYHWLQNFTY